MTQTEEVTTLKTGNYSIEMSDGNMQIFSVNTKDKKTWLAAAGDPQVAMDIVEGLILVETKRFYHPESEPTFETKVTDSAPLPPFLRKAE